MIIIIFAMDLIRLDWGSKCVMGDLNVNRERIWILRYFRYAIWTERALFIHLLTGYESVLKISKQNDFFCCCKKNSRPNMAMTMEIVLFQLNAKLKGKLKTFSMLSEWNELNYSAEYVFIYPSMENDIERRLFNIKLNENWRQLSTPSFKTNKIR